MLPTVIASASVCLSTPQENGASTPGTCTHLGQLGHDGLLVPKDEVDGGAHVHVVAQGSCHHEAQHVASAVTVTNRKSQRGKGMIRQKRCAR